MESQPIRPAFSESLAESKPASAIFVGNSTAGNDWGVTRLIDLMGNHGVLFYKSPVAAKNSGPDGLIAGDDTLIIKVNSQWDERGGTNTDLLKALIKVIVDHPGGFTGEIIVADNGQAQYGATGGGGSLDYRRNNAEDTAQSVQRVVDSFTGSRVSTYLWDSITTRRVREYSAGDIKDGYVTDAVVNPGTGAMVSYPKFKTKFGTRVSLKLGTWDSKTETYDSGRLKLVNLPVLKSHRIYGVTACVKHYMGVVADKLTAQLGARAHTTVATGGLGTAMVETRFPILNLLDAIWVNANPGQGPRTDYEAATRANLIVAGTDPVALDYWAAKKILMPLAQQRGYRDLAPINPDNTEYRCFGQWLRLSMAAIRQAGYQVTVDEAQIKIQQAQVELMYLDDARQERVLQSQLKANPGDTVLYEYYKRGLGQPDIPEGEDPYYLGAESGGDLGPEGASAPTAYSDPELQAMVESITGTTGTLYNPKMGGVGAFGADIPSPNEMSRSRFQGMDETDLGVLGSFLRAGVEVEPGGPRVGLNESDWLRQTKQSWVPTLSEGTGGPSMTVVT